MTALFFISNFVSMKEISGAFDEAQKQCKVAELAIVVHIDVLLKTTVIVWLIA